MDANAKSELSSIKKELKSIISELESISNGIRNDFHGLGNEICSDRLNYVIDEKLYPARSKLSNLDTSTLKDDEE